MATRAPLNEFPLFQNLPGEMLDQFAKICNEEMYRSGDTVFREGNQADKLHFLLSGNITLKVRLTSRPDSITVSAVNQRYESFGWSGIVPPFHYTASAVCEEDCRVLTIPGEEFLHLLKSSPEAGFVVMRRITEIIASRLRNSRQALLKTI
jgi:CRP/FNR family cyclic AMP-dependent transcriptional regulator